MCDKETIAPGKSNIHGAARAMTIHEVLERHIDEKNRELQELRVLLGCLPRDVPYQAAEAIMRLLHCVE